MKKKKTKTIFQKKKIDEQFFIETVEKITHNLVHKFKFGYHTPADIKQQAYIYALEGLEKYDNSRPLENFLWTHIRNRLFNYKRNNYKRPDAPCLTCPFFLKNEANTEHNCSQFEIKTDCDLFYSWNKRNSQKQSLMNLSVLEAPNSAKTVNVNQEDKELLDKIEQSIIDPEIRKIYIKHKNHCKVSKADFTKLTSYIKSLNLK